MGLYDQNKDVINCRHPDVEKAKSGFVERSHHNYIKILEMGVRSAINVVYK